STCWPSAAPAPWTTCDHPNEAPEMTLSPRARLAFALVMAVGLAVIYVPLIVVLVSSFNTDRTFSWPPNGLTLNWWDRAWHNTGARAALGTSGRAGAGA